MGRKSVTSFARFFLGSIVNNVFFHSVGALPCCRTPLKRRSNSTKNSSGTYWRGYAAKPLSSQAFLTFKRAHAHFNSARVQSVSVCAAGRSGEKLLPEKILPDQPWSIVKNIKSSFNRIQWSYAAASTIQLPPPFRTQYLLTATSFWDRLGKKSSVHCGRGSAEGSWQRQNNPGTRSCCISKSAAPAKKMERTAACVTWSRSNFGLNLSQSGNASANEHNNGDPFPIHAGVWQGCALSPRLFCSVAMGMWVCRLHAETNTRGFYLSDFAITCHDIPNYTTVDPKQFTVSQFRLKPVIFISECFCSRCGHTNQHPPPTWRETTGDNGRQDHFTAQ